MESLRREREAHEQLAARPTGISVRWPRVWAKQVKAAGHEAEILALPADPHPSAPTAASSRHLWGVTPVGRFPF